MHITQWKKRVNFFLDTYVWVVKNDGLFLVLHTCCFSPTFFFWLEALIPCLPHSLASICALKKTQSQHRVASNFQPGELNSENTCDETGTGWWGFCEPCWWSRQLQVLRWHRPQGLGFLPQDCELLRSETAAASHSPLRPIIQIIIQIVHELYPQLLF